MSMSLRQDCAERLCHSAPTHNCGTPGEKHHTLTHFGSCPIVSRAVKNWKHLIVFPVLIHAAWPTSVKLNSWWHFLQEKKKLKSRGSQDCGIAPRDFLVSHYAAVYSFWQWRHQKHTTITQLSLWVLAPNYFFASVYCYLHSLQDIYSCNTNCIHRRIFIHLLFCLCHNIRQLFSGLVWCYSTTVVVNVTFPQITSAPAQFSCLSYFSPDAPRKSFIPGSDLH